MDQLNTIDDSVLVEKFCNNLDFSKIVPQLVIKPIINPFDIVPPKKINKRHINLLRNWNSVSDSVRNSVSDSVWNSVSDSVWNSVWNSVYTYVGSFFKLDNWKYIKHKKGIYLFQSVVDLWEIGLVPSFDGSIWRLHGNKYAKILWEGKI